VNGVTETKTPAGETAGGDIVIPSGVARL